MNTIKRAIIIAAGLGKRMQPVTFEIPKPLVTVNGVRMIDTVIQGLHNNGIYEIYIVVGYLKEKFKVLETDYQGITIIENPYYDSCNNISSLYMAREHLEDAIIMDGDQIIYDDSILSPSFEKSGYNAVWTEQMTQEWLMQTEGNRVISCSRNGGDRGWQLFSISRWTAEDGQKLKKFLEEEFEENKNRQIYWDDVPMFCHFTSFDLGIYPMAAGSVIEVDNLEELTTIDKSYEKFLEKSL